jgi:hypothetical protein
METISERSEVCPFTLELCEHCCVRRGGDRQEPCPFTLEPCLLSVVDRMERFRN